nr:MAG TPA: hypothetical protein [Caudoviricetes sp.]
MALVIGKPCSFKNRIVPSASINSVSGFNEGCTLCLMSEIALTTMPVIISFACPIDNAAKGVKSLVSIVICF